MTSTKHTQTIGSYISRFLISGPAFSPYPYRKCFLTFTDIYPSSGQEAVPGALLKCGNSPMDGNCEPGVSSYFPPSGKSSSAGGEHVLSPAL